MWSEIVAIAVGVVVATAVAVIARESVKWWHRDR